MERESARLPGAAALERLVALACHAPSIHNTQPWAWRVGGDTVTLHADRSRALPVEDPQGRGLVLSCGAALHHLTWAARTHGRTTTTHLLPDGPHGPLARVHVGPSDGTGDADDLALLTGRCTDRRRFTDWPVPAEHLGVLVDVARAESAQAVSVSELAHRFRLEALLHRVDDVLALDSARLAEQAAWIDRGPDDGLRSEAVLGAGTALAHRFAPEHASALGAGEGLLLLGSGRDDVLGWLQAGRALSALWLEANRAGLSVVPASQVVEVEPARREIEEHVLGGAFRAHLMLRVGWQAIGRSDLPRTPRRPLADVLLG